MKNTILLCFFSFAALFSFAQDSDGKAFNDRNAQKRNVQGFHGIEISSGIDLYLSQGSEEAVAVSAADTEDRDRIVTEVNGGVLHIYIDNRNLRWLMHNHRRLRAYVSCKQIDQLEASGGSDVYIQDAIRSENLRMHFSGGSDFRGKLNVGDLNISQSGGADSYLSGSVRSLYVHASGGSDFHGYDLVSDNCQVEASGGSDAYVYCNKELTAHASGGSDIHYKGSAVLRESRASGSGSISRRD